MLYYIYYGYVGGYVLYKAYEYSDMIRYVYETINLSYKVTAGAYNIIVKPAIKRRHIEDKLPEISIDINDDSWEFI